MAKNFERVSLPAALRDLGLVDLAQEVHDHGLRPRAAAHGVEPPQDLHDYPEEAPGRGKALEAAPGLCLA